MRTSAVVAAAVLTFASLAHAQVTTPAPKDFRLVWLISKDSADAPPPPPGTFAIPGRNQDQAGTLLGMLAFPEHMTLAACSARVARAFAQRYTPFELHLGGYIAERLNSALITTSALCLTDAETAALVSAVKTQTDDKGDV